MFSLCLSGGVIYLLPYLREMYREPLRAALQMDNAQFGLMASILGVTNMVCYLPGGWLADRYSARKLLTFSMISSGLLGYYYMTFPPFWECLLLHLGWSLTSILTFWAALIRATREWASPENQPRAFGILEGGRGLARSVVATALLGVFALVAARSSENEALSVTLAVLSTMYVGTGVLVWFLVAEPDESRASAARENRVGPKEVLAVLRMPVVWLLSLVIICAYTVYVIAFYIPSFATAVFEASTVFGASLGVGKMWMAPLCAVGAGLLGNRLGASRTIAILCFGMALGCAAFAVVPASSGWLWLVVAATALVAMSVYAVRGLYFAILEEGRVPSAVTGTATGIVSIIGYTPDIFVPLAGGVLLDTLHEVTAYRVIFGSAALLSIVGLIAALMILKVTRRIPTS